MLKKSSSDKKFKSFAQFFSKNCSPKTASWSLSADSEIPKGIFFLPSFFFVPIEAKKKRTGNT